MYGDDSRCADLSVESPQKSPQFSNKKRGLLKMPEGNHFSQKKRDAGASRKGRPHLFRWNLEVDLQRELDHAVRLAHCDDGRRAGQRSRDAAGLAEVGGQEIVREPAVDV